MQYAAHAFHHDLEHGRCSGTLEISPSAFVFRSKDGRSIEVSVNGLNLKLGGAANRLVFFSHPDCPDWSFYTSDRSVLANRALAADAAVANQIQTITRRRYLRRLLLSAVATIVLAIPIGIWFSYDPLVAHVAQRIPAEWERELAEQQFENYRSQTTVIEDPAVRDALAKLVSVVTAHVSEDHYTYEVHLAQDPSINAFALPGGIIVLHTGLVMAADSAEELLGVVAHEIAHVTERHGMRALIGATGLAVMVQALFGDLSGALGVLASVAPVLVYLEHSREFELEADREAFRILEQARVNPRGLPEFFGKIIQQRDQLLESAGVEEASRTTVAQTLAILSTHPATESRVHQIEALIESSDGPYVAFDSEFAALRVATEAAIAAPTNGGSSQDEGRN